MLLLPLQELSGKFNFKPQPVVHAAGSSLSFIPLVLYASTKPPTFLYSFKNEKQFQFHINFELFEFFPHI